MRILAFDPGMSGGIALIDSSEIKTWAMPTLDGRIDLISIREIVVCNTLIEDVFVIEQAGMRPGQATQSGFKFAQGFGELIGLLTGLCRKPIIVSPQKWSKEFAHGVTETEDKKSRQRQIKKSRKEIVSKLFPGIDLRETSRCRTLHEGMTDALLIAEWARREIKRGLL